MKNADHRHAGMDCRHPGSQGCLRKHHVNLDSSIPCWNGAIEGFCLKSVVKPIAGHVALVIRGGMRSGDSGRDERDQAGKLNHTLAEISGTWYTFF